MVPDTSKDPASLEPLAVAVREHGDVIDAGFDPVAWLKVGAGLIGGNILVQHLINELTGYERRGLALAGVCIGSTLVSQVAVRKAAQGNRRAKAQLKVQEQVSQQTGESVELFRDEDEQLCLRWYGAHKNPENLPPLGRRAKKIADMAKATRAEQVVVPADVGRILDVNQPAVPESEWVHQMKPAKRGLVARDQEVLSLPATEFTRVVNELSPDFLIEDTRMVAAGLKELARQEPHSKLGRLIRSDDFDMQNPCDLHMVIIEVSRRIERNLGFSERKHGDYEKTHYRGQLRPANTGLAALHPQIYWFGNGTFAGTESVAGYFKLDQDSSMKILRDEDAPKQQKHEAALLLVYLEAQKSLAGVSFNTAQDWPVETPQTPYQASLVSRSEEMVSMKGPDFHVRKFLAKAALMAAGVGAVLYGTHHVPEDFKTAIANNPAVVAVNDGIEAPLGAVADYVDTKIKRVPQYSSKNARKELADLHSVGNVAPDRENYPVWNLELHNDADSSGYWLTEVNHIMDFKGGESAPEWGGMRGEVFRDITLAANPTGDQLKNLPLVQITRTLVPSLLTARTLPIPVKYQSQLIAAHVVDAEGQQYPLPLMELVNGSVVADFSQSTVLRDLSASKNTNKFTIEYWLSTNGGTQGIGRATRPVDVVNLAGESRAVTPEWSEHGLSDMSLSALNTYIRENKAYGLSPLPRDTFENDAEFLAAVLDSQALNCNLASSALVLFHRSGLNYASGFLNTNTPNGPTVLSAHERHAFAVDSAGSILDASPSIEPGSLQADFFKEEFTVADTTEETSLLEAGVLIGATGLAAGMGGYLGLRQLRARRAQKNAQQLNDEQVQAAYDIINHALYAPKDASVVFSKRITPKDANLTSLKTFTIPSRFGRKLARYSKKGVSRQVIRQARLLADFSTTVQ